MIALLCIAAALAEAPEWRAQAGAEVNASSFGILDLGWEKDGRSIEWRTDTLDLRWQDAGDAGRRWFGGRVELGAAGLLLGPWTDGAPDPTRALSAGYAGVDWGRLWYGRAGLYAGYAVTARGYWFGAQAQTTIDVPAPRGLITTDGVLGWWTPQVQAWARVGVDVFAELRSPHAHLELKARPEWPLAPAVELRAGLAARQDYLTATRLGGLNPYVVPLAGAGWAEWWVEDYVAVRGKVDWQRERFALAAFADVARFDGQSAFGFGGSGELRRGPLYASLAYGYAPFIERQAGVGRASVFFMLGRSWAPTRARTGD